MARGKQPRLFLGDGTSTGLLAAEIMNWTGKIVSGSPSDLNEVLGRGEASSPGDYILGDNPANPDRCMLCIGEAGDVAVRLRQHNCASAGKDFWDRVVFLTSKDANLAKALVRYLESQLISLAVLADRFELENDKRPPFVNLPGADISDMEYFLSQTQLVMPILGVDAFRIRALPSTVDGEAESEHSSPIFEMTVPREQRSTRGQDIDGDFVVAGDRVLAPCGRAAPMAMRDFTSGSSSLGRLPRSETGWRSRVTTLSVARAPRRPSSPVVRVMAVLLGETLRNGQTYAQWQEQFAPQGPNDERRTMKETVSIQ